jgi:hypothetical protein
MLYGGMEWIGQIEFGIAKDWMNWKKIDGNYRFARKITQISFWTPF